MGIGNLILGLVVVTIVIVAAVSIGRAILGLIFKKGPAFADSPLSDVFAAAAGTMLLTCVLFAIVALRLAHRGVLLGIIAACAVAAAPTIIRWAKNAPALLKRSSEGKIWTLATGVYFVVAAALSALPPTLNDELIYHLAIPKAWLATHGGFFFPDNIYAYFPQSGELFFMLGLGTAGEMAAKLFHVAFGFLLFLAVYRFASGILDRRHARLAAFALFAVPTIMAIISAAYVDLTFTLFAFLAVVSIGEYFRSRDLRHCFLAGLMLGGAIGVKYTGLQMTALVLCLVAVHRLRTPDLPILKPVALIALPAAVCALPWFVRNWVLTGWPMFPFALPFFSIGPGLNWDPERAGLFLRFLQAFGAPPDGGTLIGTLTAPVRVFFQGRFNSAEFFDGVTGPVFLLIPLLLLPKKARKGIAVLAMFSVLFLVYWAFSTRQVRFLLPVLPFLCILLAHGCQSAGKRWLTGFVGLLLIFGVFLGAREIAKKAPWDFWAGRVSRAEYVVRENPILSIYSDANRLTGPGDKLYLVNMRNYGYCLDRAWEGDFVFERYRLDRLLESKPSLTEILEYFERSGTTHVMINRKSFSSNRTPAEKESVKLFFRFLNDACNPVFERGDYGLFKIR
jgi:hypothetical protein